jgi:uncharacterized protein (DUF2147 family)
LPRAREPDVTLARLALPLQIARNREDMLMKHIAIAALLALAAGTALADPVEGTWKTKADDNGHFGWVQIEPCGPAFCGTLVKAFDETGAEIASPNIGKKIVWDMVAQGEGAYGDGKIWSPDRDKTYNSKMQLSGDALQVSGCVFGICRDGGTWGRVN